MKAVYSTLLLLLVYILLSGCARKLSDNHYTEVTKHMADAQLCLERGRLSPELYAKQKIAIQEVLKTWNYDSSKLNRLYTKYYRSDIATHGLCDRVEIRSYEILAKVAHRDKQQSQSTYTGYLTPEQLGGTPYRPIQPSTPASISNPAFGLPESKVGNCHYISGILYCD